MSYKASQKQLSASVYQNRQTTNDVTASAVELYVKALYAQKKVAITMNNLEYQKTKLAEIEAFRSAGKKSLADVLQQQTAVAEGEASLLSTQQEYGRLMFSMYMSTLQQMCRLQGLYNSTKGLCPITQPVAEALEATTPFTPLPPNHQPYLLLYFP